MNKMLYVFVMVCTLMPAACLADSMPPEEVVAGASKAGSVQSQKAVNTTSAVEARSVVAIAAKAPSVVEAVSPEAYAENKETSHSDSISKEAPKSKKVIREAILKTAEPDFVIGKVDEMLFADLLTRPKSKITIVSGTGDRIEFAVSPAAVVYDEMGKLISLTEIKQGGEIQVNYKTTSSGSKEAKSIKALK